MFSVTEDVKCGSYPNLSKNTIKFKCSSILFSLFVSAVGLLFSLSFGRPSGCDYRSSHWCRDVNSRRSRSRLLKKVLVKQADELSEVLDH